MPDFRRELPKLEYYPGSSTPVKDYGNRKTARSVEPDPDQMDLGNPKIVTDDGTEFFPIGVLALVLNRKPVTIRLWEKTGVIPSARYRFPAKQGLGKQRLYTRHQIESAVRIAYQEGILTETWRPIGTTKFAERLREAWEGN